MNDTPATCDELFEAVCARYPGQQVFVDHTRMTADTGSRPFVNIHVYPKGAAICEEVRIVDIFSERTIEAAWEHLPIADPESEADAA